MANLEQCDLDRLRQICHDLRTPLNTVLGWTYVLRTCDPTRESLAEGLDAIERNARAQAEIIDELLRSLSNR
jgi:signal transduction histidine kinase